MKDIFGILRTGVLFICLMAGIGATAAAQPAADAETNSAAIQALTAQEQKLGKAEDKFETFYVSTRLAPLAFTAGDMKKAGLYADSLLKQAGSFQENWNYGNAIHAANLVLGRIELTSGNLDEAKRFLLAAGKTPGSPQLGSFGPDMLFAKELLAKGEKKTVLEYFELCAKFWRSGQEKLAKWTADVEKDEVPDFGPNERYFFNSPRRQYIPM